MGRAECSWDGQKIKGWRGCETDISILGQRDAQDAERTTKRWTGCTGWKMNTGKSGPKNTENVSGMILGERDQAGISLDAFDMKLGRLGWHKMRTG